MKISWSLSNRFYYIFPLFIWLITGYPLRQILPEELGLIVAGCGLSLSFFLLLLNFILQCEQRKQLIVNKRLLYYSVLWILFLIWGFISNFVSSSGSNLYQSILGIGVIAALLYALNDSIKIKNIFMMAFYITFPFIIYWWINWLSSDSMSVYAYRNPSFGVISVIALCSACFLFRFPINIAVEGLIITSLVLNGQRASSCAGIVILLIQSLYYVKNYLKYEKKMSKFIFICFFSLFVFILILNFDNLYAYFINDILYLHDKYRGIASGFSYRFQVWNESLKLILNRPMFGWGARGNEFILQNFSLVPFSSTHNGILVNLVDYGIPGGSLALILMFWPIMRATKIAFRTKNKEYLLISTLGIGYLVLSVGERFWFNMGNPTSVVVLLSLFYVMANG